MNKFHVDKPKQHETSRGVSWATFLYLDNGKIAHVENRGDGGCDIYTWICNDPVEKMKAYFEAATVFNANEEDPEIKIEAKPFELNSGDFEDYTSMFMESLLAQAETIDYFRKQCRKNVCFTLPKHKGTQHISLRNTKLTPAIKARILQDHPDATILNEVL